jgi:hypothetical protein
MLPSPIAQTSPTTPCALEAGGNTLPVGFGNFAFLAVASRTQYPTSDFFVGCAAQTISATNTNVTISLQLADFVNAIPATKCTSLSEHCGGGC